MAIAFIIIYLISAAFGAGLLHKVITDKAFALAYRCYTRQDKILLGIITVIPIFNSILAGSFIWENIKAKYEE